MTGIKPQIRSFLVDNFLLDANAAAFGDNDSFLDLHLLDSTGFLELVSYLHEAFGVKVDDDEMLPANLDSIDSLEAFIMRKRAGSDSAAVEVKS